MRNTVLGGVLFVSFLCFSCQSSESAPSHGGMGGAGGADERPEGSGGREEMRGQNSATGGRTSSEDPTEELPDETCDENACCSTDDGEIETTDECAVNECGDDEGWFPPTGECFVCDPSPSCVGEGETGRLLATIAVDGSACICETHEGYFPGSEGSIAEKCDEDEDGWVNDRAQPSVESDNAVIRANARCDVRRIRSFFLENEAGKAFDTRAEITDQDLEQLFPGEVGVPPGLPLYESSRNDTDSQATLPQYGSVGEGRRLFAQEVNSLTKACLGVAVDVNENGIADVNEWSGAELIRSFSSRELERYYEKYREFGYFLELHDGRWEPEGDSGVYRIVERNRSADGESSAVHRVPFSYPPGTPPAALTCERHPDSLVSWDEDGRSAPNTINADFIDFSAAEMLHHSQYKCVHVVSEEKYEGASGEEHPEVIYFDEGMPLREEKGEPTELAWTFQVCDAKGSTASDDGANPATVDIECQARASQPDADTVLWAAVRYEHYEEPWESPLQPGGYRRGCSNQCADEGAAPNECWGCSAASWGEPIPLGSDTECGVELNESCDGAGVCGGCVPGRWECKDAVTQQGCTEDRVWGDNVSCQFGCDSDTGKCYPACTPEEVGCSPNGVPQVCSASGEWELGAACQGASQCVAGECLVLDGNACSMNSDCQSGVCSKFYEDSDKDGYGTKAVFVCGSNPPSKMSKVSGDCCDTDADAHPGQSAFFTEATSCGGFDYDCDETKTLEVPNKHACSCMHTDAGFNKAGWVDTPTVPDCGGSARFGVCRQRGSLDCVPTPDSGLKVQGCR